MVVLGDTPNLPSASRGLEIATWLQSRASETSADTLAVEACEKQSKSQMQRQTKGFVGVEVSSYVVLDDNKKLHQAGFENYLPNFASRRSSGSDGSSGAANHVVWTVIRNPDNPHLEGLTEEKANAAIEILRAIEGTCTDSTTSNSISTSIDMKAAILTYPFAYYFYLANGNEASTKCDACYGEGERFAMEGYEGEKDGPEV